MTSEIPYVEVHPGRVAPGVVRAAKELALYSSRDLGVPPPRVRWFTAGNHADLRHARRSGLLTVVRDRRVVGFYSRDAEDSIFVEISAPAIVVPHEVRHLWQNRVGLDVWNRRAKPALERDAEAYGRRVTEEWRRHRARHADREA